RELEILRRALRDASRDRGAVVTVFGEAGVGKTRLVDEIKAATQRRGLVLFGRAFETAQLLPFSPWVEAFRSDPTLIVHAMAVAPPWRVELARLLPELGPEPASASADPLRLFQAVLHLLQSVATQQRLMLVLEDMHWADEMSLRLLAFVARQIDRSAVIVIATAREDEMVDAPLLARTLEEIQHNPSSVAI